MEKKQFAEITAWQRKTFPTGTTDSALKHLEKEVKELQEEYWIDEGTTDKLKAEFADCFLLLFCAADRAGFDYADICQLIDEKMEVNKARKWGQPNGDGFQEHIKPSQP